MGAPAVEAHAVDRFVVGVDGSDASRSALRFAALVAGDIGAKLRVATSWSHPASAALPTGPRSLEGREEAEARSLALLQEVIGAELGDEASSARPVVLSGRPSQSLLRCASEVPGAVIVVGTRGRGGFADLVLGSTCRALLHDEGGAVVIVHPGRSSAADHVEHLVVGVDGSPGSLAAAAWAGGLAARLHAGVTAVHCIAADSPEWGALVAPTLLRDVEAALDGEWTQPIRDAGVACATRVLQQDPRPGILRAAADTGAGLVVVGRANGSGRHRWAIGNVAESVVRHAEVPVAVVPAPDHRP